MPRQHAIVGIVSDVSPTKSGGYAASTEPPPPFITVDFEDGPTTRLDMSERRAAVWADVLDDMRRWHLPVYVEADPDTGLLTELRVPMSGRVEGLTSTPTGDVAVELAPSQARHVLRGANPDFDEMLAALETARRENATVLVTESSDHSQIIDVRPPPHPREPAPVSVSAPEPGGHRLAPVSPTHAQQLFDLVSSRSCDPETAPSPCIPFLYPRNGCWARAHEMRRLMIADGTEPDKVWIRGRLTVATPNDHTCSVSWIYHVAPILDVDTGRGIEAHVVDPSMFDAPVPQAVWAYAQGDSAASLVRTNSRVFFRSAGGTEYFDDDYSQTEIDLVRFRSELTLETATYGRPPHAVCFVPDVYIRDNLQDSGLQPLVGGGISRSPDINHYRQELIDPQATLGNAAAHDRDDLFEDVEVGQPNYVYVRLQNRGDVSGDADVDVYWMPPSTLPTPASWNLLGTIAAPSVEVGHFDVAGPLVWNTVPAVGHYCFVAVVGAPGDPKPSIGTINDIADFQALIRNNNNVTWKNFDVEDHFVGGSSRFSFQIRGWPRTHYLSDLEIDLSKLPPGTEVALRVLKRLTAEAELVGLTETDHSTLHAQYRATSTRGLIRGMPLPPSDCSEATVYVTIPGASDGVYELAVLQRIDGAEVGRITKRLIVGDHPFVANRRSGEVHLANCEWVRKMNGRNKLAYRELKLALRRGYNGCHYCLPEEDTG